MKKLLLFLIFSAFVFVSRAQTYGIQYKYDAAGNRTEKNVVPLGGRKASPPQKDSLGQHAITVFPNPTASTVNVNISGFDENTKASIYLYDITGKLISHITSANNGNLLDLSQQASGAYSMRISIDGKDSIWRIIKD